MRPAILRVLQGVFFVLALTLLTLISDRASAQDATPVVPTEAAELTNDQASTPAMAALADEAPAPTLLLDGEALARTVTLGETIAVTTSPPGMMILVYDGHFCAGASKASHLAPWNYTVTEEYEGSLRAYDVQNPDSRTPCLGVTWRHERVELLLNGTEASLSVNVGTTIAVTTSPANMPVLVFDGPGCTGTAKSSETAPWDYTVNEAYEGSLRAYDLDNPDHRSPCLNVTWQQQSVVLLLNGTPQPASVTLNDVVIVETIPVGMLINRYLGHDCNLASQTGVWSGSYHEFSPTPLQVSFRATDPGGVLPASPCLNATWVPAPISLLLNGQASSLTVRSNTPVLVETSPASLPVRVYTAPGCHPGNLTNTQTTSFTLNRYDVDHISVQAVNPQYPDFPSPCLNLTWNHGTLPLTLNGQEADLTVHVNNQVTVGTSPNTGVQITTYAGRDCLPANEIDAQWTSSLVMDSSTPRELSFRASDGSFGNYDPSPCRNVTWDTIQIQLLVNKVSSGTVLPHKATIWYRAPYIELQFYATNEPTSTILAAIYPGQSCTGIPARVERMEDNNPTRMAVLFNENVTPRSTFWAIQAYDEADPTNRSSCVMVDWSSVSAEPPVSPEPSAPASPITPGPTDPAVTTVANQSGDSVVTSLPVTGHGPNQSWPIAPFLIGTTLLLASLLVFLAQKVTRRTG